MQTEADSMIQLKEDTPITLLQQDELGRKNLVELVVNAIKNKINASHSALTVGVYGAWGEGKTSLMRMVSTELASAGVMSVWYNPWTVGSEGRMIADFFAILSSFAFGSEETARAIEHYANGFLLAPEGNSYSPVAASYQTELVQCLPTAGKNLEELKNNISSKLKDDDVHPVVFIDDADRLSSQEVRSLFKLIRQVVDFDNVVYVVGIDPVAVSDALDGSYGARSNEDRSSRGRYFLEKIIQVPIVLPMIQEAVAEKQLCATIRDVAAEFGIFVEDKSLVLVAETIALVFTTMRGIVRFGNQLRFVLPSIHEETEFVDLCLMETLKYLNEQGWAEVNKQRANLLGEIPYVCEETERKKALEAAREKGIGAVVKKFAITQQDFVDGLLRGHLFTNIHHYHFNTLSKAINNRIYFSQYFVGGVPEGIIPRHDALEFASLVKENQEGAIAWVNEKMLSYMPAELERTARLTLDLVDRDESAEIAGKLCRVLSFSDMAKDFSKNLVGNTTDINLTITAFIIPRYMVKYENGMRVIDKVLEAEVLKDIYERAPLNFCMCVFYGTYSDYSGQLYNEKELFDVLKRRALEGGDLKIFEYSPFTIRMFLRVWMKVDKEGYNTYLERVLQKGGFDAGAYVVRSISAVSEGDFLEVIQDITDLFSDVWDAFKSELEKYKNKDDRYFKTFVFNNERFKKEFV